MESGRLSREIEFEFSEGGEVKAGQVRGVILRHLQRGEVDAAAKLIAASGPEVGEQLLTEDTLTASQAMKTAMADMFAKARDFERAGRAALAMGDPSRAASYFEQSYQFTRAAELYEKAGSLEQAAELYLRDLKFENAALLFERAGRVDRAADVFEKGGRYFEAGQIWAKARRLDKAVELLQKVDNKQEHFPRAVVLLGRILENAGHRDAAAARYLELVKSRTIDAVAVEAFERLADIYIAMQQHKYAQKLLSAAVAFDATRERAAKLLAALNAGDAGAMSAILAQPIPPGAALAPAAAPSTPSAQAAVPAAPRTVPMSRASFPGDRPATLASQPAMPTQRGPAPMASQTGIPAQRAPIAIGPTAGSALAPLVLPPLPGAAPTGNVPLSPEVNQLRELPLFIELTPDELRALADVGEPCKFNANEIIIEQDTDAKYFVVFFTGIARVSRTASDGMFPLAELGVGAAVGEMALFDEGQTSARVKAHTAVTGYRWPLDKLRGHLAVHERTALRLLRVLSRTLSLRLRETNRRLTA